MKLTLPIVAVAVLLSGSVFGAANAAPTPAPSPSAAASVTAPGPAASVAPAAPTPTIAPLTDAELKDPTAALAASRRTMGGDAFAAFGGVFVTGFAQVQGQSLPYTFAADLRTGYNRMIILLPRNGGTYEYGVDKAGGWSSNSGALRSMAASPQSVKTALYVNRYGFLKSSDAAALKQLDVDPNLGDRILITPTGAAQLLALVKPVTTLVSALQYGNGQIDVFADYRPVSGVLFPYRRLQGANANALSTFQANNVELTQKQPDAGPVSRPTLTVSGAPAQPKAVKPAK